MAPDVINPTLKVDKETSVPTTLSFNTEDVLPQCLIWQFLNCKFFLSKQEFLGFSSLCFTHRNMMYAGCTWIFKSHVFSVKVTQFFGLISSSELQWCKSMNGSDWKRPQCVIWSSLPAQAYPRAYGTGLNPESLWISRWGRYSMSITHK